METLAAQLLPYEQFDQNKRDYDDLTTLFAEMVDGSMRTPFAYRFDGQELYARDGGKMGLEFEKGLEAADRIANARPNLYFEVRRRRSEIDEYHDMLAMAHGKLPNTMVVVSDFPPELMDSTQDVGGYNVRRKQAMLRILAWDGHQIKMYSQSLDRSDRQALESIYHSLGFTTRSGELLGQRMHVALDSLEQNLLIDRLTAVYDQTMQRQFGGSNWHAGRPDGSRINTYEFVREQHDIIRYAMQAKRSESLDVYKVAASLAERLHANKQLSPELIGARYDNPFHNLSWEMMQAAQRARLGGKVFSACGISVEAPAELGLDGQLQAAGYGNKTGEASAYKFDKKMHCLVCQAPPKKGDPKKMCGPCGICRSCDKHLQKKG